VALSAAFAQAFSSLTTTRHGYGALS
jgi:hypothetical protein